MDTQLLSPFSAFFSVSISLTVTVSILLIADIHGSCTGSTVIFLAGTIFFAVLFGTTWCLRSLSFPSTELGAENAYEGSQYPVEFSEQLEGQEGMGPQIEVYEVQPGGGSKNLRKGRKISVKVRNVLRKH